MDILLAAITLITVTVVLIGSGLAGWRMWLRAKTERLKVAGDDDVERLGEVVEAVHEQLSLLRDEVGELHERIDFTERLLARGGSLRDVEPEQVRSSDPGD